MDVLTPVVNPFETPAYQQGFNIIFIIFAIFFSSFDCVLLAAAYHNRRDISLPLAYITVMCITGILASLCQASLLGSYNFLSDKSYQAFVMGFGREASLIGTFGYLTSLSITLLMTINRLVVVTRPFQPDHFTQTRIFIYSAIIAVPLLVSLLIPYFSDCYVTFDAVELTFVSGCAPERHPLTTIRNKYAIIVPVTCMFANLGLILHIRFLRNGTYVRISNSISAAKWTSTTPASQPTALSKIQARRELIMLRQTISVAIFFSIYEFGALLMRLFPDEYASLPKLARDVYFYLRYSSIPALTFFLYYIETGSTRRMIRRYLRIPENNNESVVNATVVAVTAKSGGGKILNRGTAQTANLT